VLSAETELKSFFTDDPFKEVPEFRIRTQHSALSTQHLLVIKRDQYR
jgi:hypothetical protein